MPKIHILKRYILLYKLGVDLPSPYNFLIPNLFRFFTPYKTTEMLDSSKISNICYLDFYGNILFCTRTNTDNEKEIIISDHYYHLCEHLRTLCSATSDYELHTLSCYIRDNLGLKYDYAFSDKYLNIRHIKYLKPLD